MVSNVSDNVIYNNNMISASNIISHNDTTSDVSNQFSPLTPSIIHHVAYTNANGGNKDSNFHKAYVKNMTSELFLYDTTNVRNQFNTSKNKDTNKFDLDNSNSLVNIKSIKKENTNAKLTTQEDSLISYTYQNENSINEHKYLSLYQNQQMNYGKQPELNVYKTSMKSPSGRGEDSLNYSATPAQPQISQDYIPDFYHPKTPNYFLNPNVVE